MKTRSLIFLLCALAVLPLSAQTNLRPTIFPAEDPLTPESLRLVWPTTPGLRYEVQQSTNRQTFRNGGSIPTNRFAES